MVPFSQIRLRLAKHYLGVLRSTQQSFLKGRTDAVSAVARFDEEWPQIEETARAWSGAAAGEDEVLARLCSDYCDAAPDVLQLRQRPDERIRWLEQALVAAHRFHGPSAVARHLGNLAAAYVRKEDTHKAIELLQQSLTILQDIKDRPCECAALGNLGTAHATARDFPLAIKCYEEALAIARELGDRQREGGALTNLANAHREMGDLNRSVDLCQQARTIAKELGHRHDEAIILLGLALTYEGLGQFDQASECNEQALRFLRDMGVPDEAVLLNNVARVSLEAGNASRAVEHSKAAAAVARRDHNDSAECTALGNLSGAYIRLSDSAQARDSAEGALRLARTSGDRRREGQLFLNLGAACHQQGDATNAEAAYRECFARACEFQESSWLQEVVGNLGQLYAGQCRWLEAEQLCQSALELLTEPQQLSDKGRVLIQLAVAQGELGKLGDAHRTRDEAYALLSEVHLKPDEATSLVAELLRLGQAFERHSEPMEAFQEYSQGLTVALRMNPPNDLLSGAALNRFSNLARHLLEEGNWQLVWKVAWTTYHALDHLSIPDGHQATLLSMARHLIGLYNNVAASAGNRETTAWQAALRQAGALDEMTHEVTGVVHWLERLGQSARETPTGPGVDRQGVAGHHVADYEEKLRTHRAHGNRVGEANTLAAMALLHSVQNRTADAIRCYQESASIWRHFGNCNEEAKSLSNLIPEQFKAGNFEDALESATSLVAILSERHDYPGLATCHVNRGVLLSRLGKKLPSLEAYLDALVSTMRTPSPSAQRVQDILHEVVEAARTLIEEAQFVPLLQPMTRAYNDLKSLHDASHDQTNPAHYLCALVVTCLSNVSASMGRRGTQPWQQAVDVAKTLDRLPLEKLRLLPWLEGNRVPTLAVVELADGKVAIFTDKDGGFIKDE